MPASASARGWDALKYIAITECQSGRWHHHLIINGGLTLDELRAVWGTRGRLMVSTLDDTYTYEELARYLTRGHKPRRGAEGAENAKTPRRKGARRWHASRNLARPVETKRQIARAAEAGGAEGPEGIPAFAGLVRRVRPAGVCVQLRRVCGRAAAGRAKSSGQDSAGRPPERSGAAALPWRKGGRANATASGGKEETQ